MMTKKPCAKMVVSNYYVFDEEMVRQKNCSQRVGEKWFEKADIWPELNLMEVEMNFDSLILPECRGVFYRSGRPAVVVEERGIKTKSQII